MKLPPITPGPWGRESDDGFTITDAAGKVVAMVWPDLRLPPDQSLVRMRANTKACAAVPALLGAAVTCLHAERERRKKLKPGAPATTYTEERIAETEAALRLAGVTDV